MKTTLAAIAVALSVLGASTPSLAAGNVPTQAEWADAKKTVELPNGQTLAYVELGDPAGKPTLLVHGYTDNSRSWSLLAPHLASRRLIAVDLRGHGKSEAPDCCYAFTDLAHDLSLFLKTLDLDRVDYVGHSLGSMTGILLAAQHPEQVEKLVLISTSTEIGSGPGSWLWDNVLPLKAPIDPNSKFMMDWYWNPNPVDEDFITRERTESAATPIQVWHGVLWATAMADLIAITPMVKAPVLVLWGDQDSLFDATHQERVKKAFPAARFETFAGAGHNMFWEFPERSGKLIGEFLDQQ